MIDGHAFLKLTDEQIPVALAAFSERASFLWGFNSRMFYKPVKLLSVKPLDEIQPVYQISVGGEQNNSKKILLTGEHLIYTNLGWKTAEELTDTDEIMVFDAMGIKYLRYTKKSVLQRRRRVYEVTTENNEPYVVNSFFVKTNT